MKIYVVENELNTEICELLKINKYCLELDKNNINQCQVIVISKVENNSFALKIVEYGLQNGIEIICIKPKKCREDFLCNLLIKEGAIYI